MTISVKVYIEMTLKEETCSWLMALMQNEIDEDESHEDSNFRQHIFNRAKTGKIHPAGRVREATSTFAITEEAAIWLFDLVDMPLYEDETEKEEKHREVIKDEFWCPNILPLHESLRFWDHIPF